VAVSFEGSTIHPPGLREHLVVHGRATIEEGGAAELLQELAHVHLGPTSGSRRWTIRRRASGCESPPSGSAGSAPGPVERRQQPACPVTSMPTNTRAPSRLKAAGFFRIDSSGRG
jgi:hypothetical protein